LYLIVHWYIYFLKIILLCGLSFVLTFFPKPYIKLIDLNSFSFKIES
jgi:hypothetical protein